MYEAYFTHFQMIVDLSIHVDTYCLPLTPIGQGYHIELLLYPDSLFWLFVVSV